MVAVKTDVMEMASVLVIVISKDLNVINAFLDTLDFRIAKVTFYHVSMNTKK